MLVAVASLTIGGKRPAAIARPTGWSQHPPVSGAIPRVYSGITFRSTTEARFARWFDLLGLTWTFEAEGYRDGSVCAMPDFWLPQVACHVEIKHADDYNRAKFHAVARASGYSVLVATSAPWMDSAFTFTRVYPDGTVDDGWMFSRWLVGDDGEPVEPDLLLEHRPEPDQFIFDMASQAGNLRFWNAVR